jgi:hypothetical protein
MQPLAFWEFTLDCPNPDSEDWVALIPPHGGPRLAFQRSDAPVLPWPSGARTHLDLAVPDLTAAHEHLVACGARPLTGSPAEEGHPDDLYRVYADIGRRPPVLRHPRQLTAPDNTNAMPGTLATASGMTMVRSCLPTG